MGKYPFLGRKISKSQVQNLKMWTKWVYRFRKSSKNAEKWPKLKYVLFF